MGVPSCIKLIVSGALALSVLMPVWSSGASASGVQIPRSSKSSTIPLVHPGYLTVGSDTTYPPMEAEDPNHPGTYVGADIDLASALAHAMGLRGAIIVNNSFDTIIPALQRHRFDVIMSSMNDTPARAKVIAFVDYLKASEAIVVKKSSSVHANSYSGVCGLTISVESGTTELYGMEQANKKCGKKIDIKQFTADTDAFQAFMSGHSDAYTGDLPVAALYTRQHNDLRLAGRPFGATQHYGIGLLKSAKSLRSGIVHALGKIKATGQYSRILKKWGVGGASF